MRVEAYIKIRRNFFQVYLDLPLMRQTGLKTLLGSVRVYSDNAACLATGPSTFLYDALILPTKCSK